MRLSLLLSDGSLLPWTEGRLYAARTRVAQGQVDPGEAQLGPEQTPQLCQCTPIVTSPERLHLQLELV